MRIDPRTNRPTVRLDGEEVQLWDGIHRLENGGELTVIEGRVVPSKTMARERGLSASAPGTPTTGTGQDASDSPAMSGQAASDLSVCAQLVRQACGADDACADREKCSAARQLAEMAREAWRSDPGGTAVRDLVAKCREALADDFFSPCTSGEAADGSR